MRIVEIIESKRWENKKTGKTASIYGAVPYKSERDKKDWDIVKVGYTWKVEDGTIGFGTKPVKTYAEALEVMNQVNRRDDEYKKAWKQAMETENDDN